MDRRRLFLRICRHAKRLSPIELILVIILSTQILASDLASSEKRGRVIYLKTISPSGGEINAVVGEGGIDAPGSALPCVNCHGFEGEGLEEHGISATNIAWEDLTKSYWGKRTGTRQYPPYNEATLERAIREGLDPAGNALDPSMPRYRLSNEDMEDLIAYLKVIHRALDPGITDHSIKLGSVLPTTGSFGATGLAMKRLLESYFDEVNASGGVFNRKIILRVREYGSTPEASQKVYDELIDKEEVFAIVSPFDSNSDTEHLSALIENREVPTIGPFTLYPDDIHVLNRYTFYLYSGLREQARAQVEFARKRFGADKIKVAIVYPEKGARAQDAEAIDEQVRQCGWRDLEKIVFSPDAPEWRETVVKLKAGSIGMIFFLGSFQDLKQLAEEADNQRWTPYTFVSGALVKPEIFELPASFARTIFAAYPTLPGDYTQEGMRQLNELGTKYDLSRSHLTAQVSAYCSAKLIVEGLRRAGSRPSREKLVSQLEQLDKFETGLTPEMSFGPNRRIGSLGAYIVALDIVGRTLSPVDGWISLN
jgi:ABC-type branched-subunit amino acid transport system substrate-binding protein